MGKTTAVRGSVWKNTRNAEPGPRGEANGKRTTDNGKPVNGGGSSLIGFQFSVEIVTGPSQSWKQHPGGSYAYCSRRPFGSGTDLPNSLAVSSQRPIASWQFESASSAVWP